MRLRALQEWGDVGRTGAASRADVAQGPHSLAPKRQFSAMVAVSIFLVFALGVGFTLTLQGYLSRRIRRNYV